MYELLPGQQAVPLERDAVIEVFSAVNQPQIAAEGVEAQEAQAYICSGHHQGAFQVYIYLHMRVTNVALVYAWDEPVTKASYTDVRNDALQFTESMGFMMEDLSVRRLDPVERARLLSRLPIFTPLEPPENGDDSAVAGSEDDDVVVLEDKGEALPPDDSILVLRPEPASTQVDFDPAASSQEADQGLEASDPLQDKNFKVFLRLLTSA